ncbi:hypothetical protein GPJ56_010160 [Histomonas meleagridis]|uniref:uncharacterized protein n=1 Tax=Histomonas meleagridis TaxID=135588 RepID=UPI00355AA7B5|nr:hypothetical protein GPJ56_010160 [Histomonas meleagridis]KAH0804696.1 hypothetical protein GO595_002390 [Histomonas meleagridis]
MEEIEGEQNGKEPEEIQIGFMPSSPEMVIPQIHSLSTISRTIGFESLINCTNNGLTPELQALLDQGVFPLVISQMCTENQKIIGVICTAARRLSAIAPQQFDALIERIPFQYLLSIQKNPEVIDFLQQSAENFDKFAYALLSNGDQLLAAVGQWLQDSEDTAKPALELLSTLSQIQGVNFDFNCIKPFIDGQFSPDIRSLALNILIQVDPQSIDQYLNLLLTIFLNDPLTPTVIQVLHDAYLQYIDKFQPVIPQIYARSLSEIQIPFTAVLLADISNSLDQQSKAQIITAIFAQPELTIERADAIFRIISSSNITLPVNFIDQLLSEIGKSDDRELDDCIEAILCIHHEYFSTEEGQAKIFQLFQNQNSQISAFKICLNCCMQKPVRQELMQCFVGFAQQFESEFDEEMHQTVAQFLANHK